jgi:hypothetical protein
VIDEAQNHFRAMTKLDPQLLRWLEAHRHFGVDLVILCQTWTQLTSGIHRLVEATFHCKRLWALGLNRFYVEIRGNPCDEEVIRKVGPFAYTSKVFSFYDSYAHKGTVETPRPHSIFRSPVMWMAGMAVVFVIWFLNYRPWVAAATPPASKTVKKSAEGSSSHAEGPQVSTPALPQGPERPHVIDPAVPDPVLGFRVLGGASVLDGQFKYLILNGERLYSAGELSLMWKIPIMEAVTEGGIPRLVGPGISYGSWQPMASPGLVGTVWIDGLRALGGGDSK